MVSPTVDATASTTTASLRKKSRSQNQNQSKDAKVLTQDELRRWWPFTRLDLNRFPKTPHEREKAEPALF
jgi:hypothetical protein